MKQPAGSTSTGLFRLSPKSQPRRAGPPACIEPTNPPTNMTHPLRARETVLRHQQRIEKGRAAVQRRLDLWETMADELREELRQIDSEAYRRAHGLRRRDIDLTTQLCQRQGATKLRLYDQLHRPDSWQQRLVGPHLPRRRIQASTAGPSSVWPRRSCRCFAMPRPRHHARLPWAWTVGE